MNQLTLLYSLLLVLLLAGTFAQHFNLPIKSFPAAEQESVTQEPLAAQIDPEVSYTVPQLIRARGYPAESHTVETADGYLLTVHRIPYGRRGPSANRPVVFLQHGLLDSSHSWVNNFATQSFGYVLADAGFDVWMNNVRGNLYSKANKYYPPDTDKFWEFAWSNEHLVDLKTSIDFVLRNTSQTKLAAYVGHSQGGAMGFALMSSEPEYAAKIGFYVALAPVTFLRNPGSIAIEAMAKLRIDQLVKLIGVREFLPNTKIWEILVPHICDKVKYCSNVYCLLFGCDSPQLNTTRLPVYFSHAPAGTSTQNMAQWAQAVRSGNYQRYDYGSASSNQQHYNQPVPPQFDLSKLMVKTALYYGGKDTLSTTADVNFWKTLLPQDKLVHTKFFPTWGHCDFVWGLRANDEIYQEAIDLIHKALRE